MCGIMHRLFRGQKRIIEKGGRLLRVHAQKRSADTNYVIVDRNEGAVLHVTASAYYLLRDTVKRQVPRGYKYVVFCST